MENAMELDYVNMQMGKPRKGYLKKDYFADQ